MKLDERGKQCPRPVIDTKKALESCNPGETVEVLVDNEIAVQNLSKMAASKGLSAVSEKISDNEFSVKIAVGQGVTPASGAADDPVGDRGYTALVRNFGNQGLDRESEQ